MKSHELTVPTFGSALWHTKLFEKKDNCNSLEATSSVGQGEEEEETGTEGGRATGTQTGSTTGTGTGDGDGVSSQMI